jgi:hypothetical protein
MVLVRLEGEEEVVGVVEEEKEVIVRLVHQSH